ncbi:NDUFA12-domain-containing protein [Meira miltonrushii]|uniref:NADH dehydrogenase [ubiquinone] 1 alpha subcomplex subunit n=1 Tax=Meira miltonrushii TaxID=1280837 RepID=A0A316V8K0_9BASI|nr:NDUFA12-domain-containing protein [Meira miltonrushii]PWN32513.1 NDUFA12-domain-containing protein [Meira miltonrushii]
MSLPRTISNLRKAGFKQWWRDLQYIGDPKYGRLVGTDSFGNKYFENLEEQPGRHRWIDYAAHDYNTVQVEPQWHSWLHHIRQDPPNVDPIVQAAHKTWEIQHTDSTTGSRASFRTYNTTRQKINPWEPTVAARK